MAYRNFLKKLKDNYKYEEEAQQRVTLLNGSKVINICNTSAFDFETDDHLKFEVKADHIALKTGSFFIEFAGYGKASGIEITKADYYVITDTKYYFLISVIKLKMLVENCKVKKTADGLTFGYLLPRYFLIKNSIIL